MDNSVLNEKVSAEISIGKIIGYFQGQMEFGPRALGSRSILADARIQKENPYMLFTAIVRPGQNLPSITHVDQSARLQIVDKLVHPQFHALLESFYKLTNCPALINTSFNVRGEPIVCSPYEALTCFMTTEIDVLVLENYLIKKNSQTNDQHFNWKSAYVAD